MTAIDHREDDTTGVAPRRAVPRSWARWSGALAAAVALAVGELVSSAGGGDQSLIASVGSSFIDQFAASLKDIAVAIFGTSDKAALLIGIVIISLLVGAALGTASSRRPWIGVAGFSAFGVLGVVAGALDEQASTGRALVAAILATGAGIATLFVLLRVARTGAPVTTTRTIESPTDPAATRRAFFGWAGAAGAFAIGVAAVGRAVAGQSRAEVARGSVTLPRATNAGTVGPSGTVLVDETLGIDGLTPYVMPNDEFYRIDTSLIVPEVDPATWSLKIGGMVDNPFEITYDEILAMDQIEEQVTLSCVSNSIGGDLVGNARWQGVPLSVLLERAGVQAGATQLVGTSVDGWTGGFPTELATDGRVAMLAVGMNGEPLPIPHGFPARLVISGLYGYVSATKWITEITLTTWEDFDGYWIDKGWAKEGPVKTQSRIDVPRYGTPLAAGPTKIAGVAWAPNTGITKVEVQIDGGDWYEARLGDVVSDNTWVQWVLDWDAPSGEHEILVRATDATGETQTEERTSVAPDGASGWHSRFVVIS